MPEFETILTAELFGEISAQFRKWQTDAQGFDIHRIDGVGELFKAERDGQGDKGKFSSWLGRGKAEQEQLRQVVPEKALAVHRQINAMLETANAEARAVAGRFFSSVPESAGREVDFR